MTNDDGNPGITRWHRDAREIAGIGFGLLFGSLASMHVPVVFLVLFGCVIALLGMLVSSFERRKA